MLNGILDGIANFILVDRSLLDNILSLIIYLIVIIYSLKGGVGGATFVISYLIVSAILGVLGISSIFNIVTLVTDFIKDLLKSFNPFSGIFGNIIINYIKI